MTDRQNGNRRIHRVEPDGLAALRADLERLWTGALANLKQLLEQSTQEDR